MKSKQILFFAALGCMAAPVAAQTVDVSIDCGQTYAINSTVNATAGGGLTYRWLENGSTITVTTADYTVPATKSVEIYTYIRQAKSTGCTDWQSSNAFTVEVKNKEGIDGVCLGGLMWAKYNVDEPDQFADNPESLGKLYEFNNPIPYPWGSPGSWTLPSVNYNAGWLTATDPCPVGWRIPTRDESYRLCSATNFSMKDSTIIVASPLYCRGDCAIQIAIEPLATAERAVFWTSTYFDDRTWYQYYGATTSKCTRTFSTTPLKRVRCVAK
jgi:hypothetical protein